MQFGLSETQQTLKNTVRKFLVTECPPAEVRKQMETATAFDPALWRKMVEQGWTGIIFPEEFGGFGMGMVEMAAALEEMGRALLPGPFFSTVLLAGAVLDSAGSKAQKEKYLGAICRGEAKATLALLEDSASWSPDAVRMEASGLSLTGRKLFVPDAEVADSLICVARMNGDLALVVVPAGARGVTITAQPAMDGTRKLYAVDFNSVAISRDDVLASGDRARTALDRALDIATVGLAAEMTGGMQRLLEIAVEYAKTRKQFGRAIGEFQAVQHQCADMLLFTESSRSAAYYAAYAIHEGIPEARLAVSVAKTYVSDAYREVGNRAIQIHGGMGFTWENDVHLYYRRAKASELALGDAAFHRERIAKLVVDAQPVHKEDEVAVMSGR
ncbi:MAG TPA: acyl-CoA dehydrogenase family protein [Bryobacteraceae bacterium]|nr:acyl-CoA dehydrogenase family protein [Bryobacteraceae bacterium]